MSSDLAAQAREYAELIATLIPPESVVVEDIAGTEHRLRARLPAAVETRILQSLEALRLPNMEDLLPALQEGGSVDKVSAVIHAVSRLAGDATVLDTLSRCFELAHPRAMREAEASVRADEYAAEYLPADGVIRAHHLFSVTDIVSGIVPFGLRASSRTGRMAADLLPPTS